MLNKVRIADELVNAVVCLVFSILVYSYIFWSFTLIVLLYQILMTVSLTYNPVFVVVNKSMI